MYHEKNETLPNGQFYHFARESPAASFTKRLLKKAGLTGTIGAPKATEILFFT